MHGFAFGMRTLSREFSRQQIRAFDLKVILQYNVYVILCFLHLLLKYDCVGFYRGFENLFKNFFNFQLCELLVIVRLVNNNFLSDFIYNRRRMILENTADFIITVTW